MNVSIVGTCMPHIPTLQALLNRIKLGCMASWDLFEVKRRFTKHSSLAGKFEVQLKKLFNFLFLPLQIG